MTCIVIGLGKRGAKSTEGAGASCAIKLIEVSKQR
jgi:hypothetical protein